jgi:signal transduction histidine kinase
MSATASWRDGTAAERLLVPVWAVFVAVNVVLMFLLPGAETIPYHFVWVSTALVYGLRPWRLPVMWAVCLTVVIATGVPLVLHTRDDVIGWEETTEIPLMAALFLVMVWHVRRRMAATAEASRLAESERRGQQRQRRFVRFASHELRTPITVARGFTELIRDAHHLDGDEDVEVVLDELDKLESVAARLLTLAQSDDGALAVQDVDLAALLERTARRWRAAAPDREWSATAEPLVVRGDPARLEVAVDSVVENAVRHTATGGAIRLHACRVGDEARIEIEDDGCGIAPADRQLVFESFHSSGPHAGTGLGLAIVRSVVDAHGGRAWAAAARNGSGTAITLALPMAAIGRPAQPVVAASTSRP